MFGVVMTIDFNEEQQRVLDQNTELLAQMRMEMARMGVVYTGIVVPVKRMRVQIELPWSEFLTDYMLRTSIDYVWRARALLIEMALVEFAKARVRIEAATQPKLPEPKEESKPERQT